MNILFICNQNENRSKTAELLLKDSEHNVKSAGLYNERLVTKNLIKWADNIFVFEEVQKEELLKRFPEYSWKKIVSLGIKDVYDFNHPELVDLLKGKLKELKIVF